jgi:hypothetical protein
VAFPGSTSGTTTVQATAVAGTTTFTLPATTGTAALQGDTHYVGTTAVALNRASANQALTGISSVAFPGSTSGTITVQPAAVAGTNTFTLPAATGTAALQADVHYIGTTSIALNRASASQTLTGVSIDGNAATASAVAASALTGSTLNSGVTASSLTSVGALTSLTVTGAINGTQIVGATPINSGSTGGIAVKEPASGSQVNAYIQFVNAAYSVQRGTIHTDPSGNMFLSPTSTNLTVYNNIYATSIQLSSDRTLKENLTPITDAVGKVKSITGYNYNRIGSDKLEMGVIAQEVKLIAPELISTDTDGKLTVSYPNMVALLIEAVKEQSAEIAALKEQVKELKG